MKTHPLIALRRKAGLPHARGISAAELRRTNPALADKWATFLQAKRTVIVKGLVASVS